MVNCRSTLFAFLNSFQELDGMIDTTLLYCEAMASSRLGFLTTKTENREKQLALLYLKVIKISLPAYLFYAQFF